MADAENKKDVAVIGFACRFPGSLNESEPEVGKIRIVDPNS
jgi:hypothetical protein